MDTTILLELAESAKTPSHYDRVYKEECLYSFVTPESPGGLYINMSTFHGVSEQFLPLDHRKSGGHLYLHEKWEKVPLTEEEKTASGARPTEMAIGVPGGFDPSRKDFKVVKHFAIVALDERGSRHRFDLPDALEALPRSVRLSAEALMAHESAAESDQVEAWTQERQVSKYAAGLVQLDNGKRISMDPATWVCEDSGKRENLWLNLSTGYIGSGRPIWDGEKNVGGSGAALRHYEETGRQYPLAVKLGTITPSGADVYSYAADEDDMVVDPHLRRHLLHWGIDMDSCEKTEKTVQEKEIDLNLAYEFSAITEEGKKLTPASGPGFVGLKNLGNTCYMNSVMQLLGQMDGFTGRYGDRSHALFESSPADQVVADLPAQLAKLYSALCREEGVDGAPGETLHVPPRRLKNLIGKGHPEFSSARQQDAAEYFQHLLDLLSRTENAQKERVGVSGPESLTANQFTLELEERILCTESMHVAYRHATENLLGLMIPMELATEEEVEDEAHQGGEREAKRQRSTGEVENGDAAAPAKRTIKRVAFQACLDRYIADDLVENYRSAALGGRSTMAAKSTRISKFPPFLMVQLRRYYVDEATYSAKKLEVVVDVPEQLDLEPLRGKGPRPEEQLQPEDGAPSGGPSGKRLVPDPEIVAQLTAMGFAENGVKRGCIATKNAGVEQCADWVMSHMGDPNFDRPLSEEELGGGGGQGGLPEPEPEKLAMLADMGFSREQGVAALLENGGDMERAANWLFMNMDSLHTLVPETIAKHESKANAAAAPGATVCLDGPAKYELLGFVSHMGSNTACGHYVAHLKKGGKWYLFNDEKVAESEKPPLGLGYLYLFKRVALNGMA